MIKNVLNLTTDRTDNDVITMQYLIELESRQRKNHNIIIANRYYYVVCFQQLGLSLASWLVRPTMERAVWVPALVVFLDDTQL